MYTFNLGLKFESIVKTYANHNALTFETGESLTYEMLNRQANRFARLLIDLDVRQKDVVAISGMKLAETYACMLACLKIGAVYTIFDPSSPMERINKIINTASPKALVIDNKQENAFSGIKDELDISVINTGDGSSKKMNRYKCDNLPVTQTITGENPAYLMFTSGSTGFPKGALITHQNVLNFIKWSTAAYDITTEDILTNVNPMFFDNSVFDFYASVFSGASMVPFSKKTISDPKKLTEDIDSTKCTLWFSVPTLLIFLQTMKALNKKNFKHIKRIIFGGEGYPKQKLKQLFDLYGNRAELFNVYGPTECTCICSSYKITSRDFNDLQGYPPLGQIIPNFSYLILDENNRQVPDNQLGELCLLGPNVGKGYYNDPERTAGSFVQNPCNLKYREIMYKTGDLVKYNTGDGKLHIAGRADNQIKHMGYRIELEEIETALCQLKHVSQAAVLHGTLRGLSRIIAVISTRENIEKNNIVKELRNIIPDYMIPSEIHFLDKLPKNPAGKMDRKKLREMYLADKIRESGGL
jgi:D-alanine--poly(phosphoribitol) ligase subunit 1